MNLYDSCVANKTINGTQITICLHLDDLKVSQIDPRENIKFEYWLSETYRDAVVAHRGKVHDYLGMILNFSVKGKVIVNMIKYIKNIITNFPVEIVAVRTNPATDHHFTVRNESLSKPLLEEKARAFHHALAQLFFLSARAQHDIRPATAFLTMHVSCPDEDGWGKVKRLLGYLNGTQNMPSSCWWIF